VDWNVSKEFFNGVVKPAEFIADLGGWAHDEILQLTTCIGMHEKQYTALCSQTDFYATT
jgi:hypothetical protein